MKKVFFLLFIHQILLFSQSDPFLFSFVQPDSIANINFRFCGIEKNFLHTDSLIYFDNSDSVKNFVKHKNASGPTDIDNIDFNNTALILVSYHGVDCHSQFDIKLIDDIELKEYIFTVKVIDGGCRAGGYHYTYWYKMPRLPEDYKIKYFWYYNRE